ncbi:lipase family protein [Rhodococcus sp. 27YEA15]|uniref:lipase family protein n=1 Tax=Rhodococcus sp. 27YEA15 TaxID=3156259 RepID=UPI003C798BB7
MAAVAAPAVSAQPVTDPFYQYDGTAPLSSFEPGAVLKTRTVQYSIANVPTPIQAVQVVYRSTDVSGNPISNVTSILRPPVPQPDKVVSFQSAYDSLDPADGPSRAVAGQTPVGSWTSSGRNLAFGGLLVSVEAGMFGPLLALGYTVVLPDTEGQDANFAVGPGYGMLTLDSLRAAKNVPEAGISENAQIALLGYSGGAIASNWSAILAPTYAPDVDKNLIGAAVGGVLVNPARNLTYANGSIAWSGVVGMAVVGIARSYGIDFDRYLNDFGREILAHLGDASIGNVYLQYPGLTWQSMVKPEYADPTSVPEFVEVVNKINMGTAQIPTIPMFIAQGSNGVIEGTFPGGPGIGPGDGIMIAGDVRSLAIRYCDAGLPIQYDEYDTLSHIPAAVLFTPGAWLWLDNRFNGDPAPSNCGHIAPGNSLEPVVYTGK